MILITLPKAFWIRGALFLWLFTGFGKLVEVSGFGFSASGFFFSGSGVFVDDADAACDAGVAPCWYSALTTIPKPFGPFFQVLAIFGWSSGVGLRGPSNNSGTKLPFLSRALTSFWKWSLNG